MRNGTQNVIGRVTIFSAKDSSIYDKELMICCMELGNDALNRSLRQ